MMKTWTRSLLLLLLLTGCEPASIGSETPASPFAPTATAPVPTRTSPPLPTPTEAPPSPTVPPIAEIDSPSGVLTVCSPLAGLTRSGLEDVITNPYFPPPFGSDDPHQGIDLAQFLSGTRVAVGGAVVQAALGGTVALIVPNRFPYGNAVMLETPLEDLAGADLDLPAPGGDIPVHSTLTCPGETEIATDPQRRSLYLLYAHLQDPPTLAIGESVSCGSPLGLVGDSGNALNPHLHLEVRIGPSGAVFPGMSHYSAAATPAEMDSYCAWRVGGLFRPVDPLTILDLAEW